MANIWTKQICLEEISVEEFTAIEEEWGHVMPKKEARTYGCLHNPLQADNYGELVDKFAEHPYAKRINVREGTYWRRYPVAEIKEKQKMEIVTLASKDSLQRNHFEMKFDLDLPNVQIPSQRFVDIEFILGPESIIGYKVFFHRLNSGIFDCRIQKLLPYIAGIYSQK